ncbi:PilZ domain-containing protein [Hephaestia sp. GCM10023244]|uniref:PilZ domain-containing protein n=1 Tax=unclassified Hephaestia TaxID=2631281 RepID=UPI0020775BD3|nr:PilZ domain-containing protein [Hephaestia sp. MAHUQ-44]MCM8729374.1 PilZ domain-containing protein [Hephaestia sp. MAHUQ-44]
MGLEAPIIEVSDKRRARRRPTAARVGVRSPGKRHVETRLLDISRYGFRVAAERLTPGSSVWLKLADSEPQLARVVWSDQYASGCVFLEPLDQVIYRAALRTAGIETTIIA